MRGAGRRAAAIALLLLLLSLPSCFTMGLWGFSQESGVDPYTGREESWLEYDDETQWSWKLFGLRVLLTPVTVVLDCATWPVQVFLFGDDEDDDC